MPQRDGSGSYGGGGGRGGGFGGGTGGKCVCTSCSHALPHTRGVPCTQIKCPKCGSLMVRE